VSGGAVGVPFTIIENDLVDPVIGTFEGVPEGGIIGGNWHVYRVSYRGGDGNDVALTRLAEGSFSPANRVQVQFAADDVAAPGLGREDLSLQNWSHGVPADVAGSNFTYDPVTRTATWTFPSLLPDGEYWATVAGDAIAAPQPALHRFRFFVLNGDVNRDRTVNGADFAVLASNFGRSGMTFSQGDVTGDGNVDGADFSLLAGRFGRTLPVPSTVPYPAARADAPALASPAPKSTEVASPAPRRAVTPAARPAAAIAAPTPATKIVRHPRLQRRAR
jgi:hypothetical protein